MTTHMTIDEYRQKFGKKRNKFNAKKCEADGISFDSKKEMQRYKDLKLLEKAREISAVEVKPRYEIMVNGVKVCVYIPDFGYLRGKKIVLEDTKGMQQGVAWSLFQIKRRLMQAVYGLDVEVV